MQAHALAGCCVAVPGFGGGERRVELSARLDGWAGVGGGDGRACLLRCSFARSSTRLLKRLSGWLGKH